MEGSAAECVVHSPLPVFETPEPDEIWRCSRLELLNFMGARGWQRVAKRPPPLTEGGEQVYVASQSVSREYLLALLYAEDLFATGLQEIHHLQCKQYYKALLNLPHNRLSEVVPDRRPDFYRSLFNAKGASRMESDSGSSDNAGPDVNESPFRALEVAKQVRRTYVARAMGAEAEWEPSTPSGAASSAPARPAQPFVQVHENAGAVPSRESHVCSQPPEPPEPPQHSSGVITRRRHTKTVSHGVFTITYRPNKQDPGKSRYQAHCPVHTDLVDHCTKSMQVNREPSEHHVIMRLRAWCNLANVSVAKMDHCAYDVPIFNSAWTEDMLLEELAPAHKS